jgi:hypothetical protein
MSIASYVSDPQVQYLSQLLEELGRGQIQVPRFQRPLVWEPQQQLELLRSVRDGIPMGALMVWRTEKHDVQCYPSLGRYQLSRPSAKDGAVRQYLLDGVQRLSTLYAATRLPEEVPQHDGVAFYDLDVDDFAFLESDDARTPSHLALGLLFDSVKLLKFQRAIPARSDHWIERCDRLARSFREYKVAVIPIVTDDIGMATRTFQRINSQGTEMGELHMVHALSWSSEFDLLERIAELKERYLTPVGWGQCDDERILLAACKAALGFDIYSADPDKLSSSLQKNNESVEEAISAVATAALFLRERCHLSTPDLLPYSLQAVAIAEMFRRVSSPSERSKELVSAWFWLTTYSEHFFGLSGSRLATTINDVCSMGSDEVPRWSGIRLYARKPLNEKFDFRHARAKGIALLLASRKPQSVDGDAQEPMDFLAAEPKNAIGHLLPARFVSKTAYASFGNRVILAGQSLSTLRDSLGTGSVNRSVLESHLIPAEAAALAAKGDWSKFVEARRNYINEEEEAFATRLREFYFPT